jgi:hypothetical protein
MTDFFNSVLSGPKNLSKEFLGQNYSYQQQIKSPDELGMSSEGSITAIANDIGGLISYVELLVAGGGNASKTGGPLGDRFFLKTGGQCTDIVSKNKVNRYIYVDNVPDGSLPFISSGLGGQKFDGLKGLVPGILSNVAHIEPTKIFGAFMMGANPLCMEVKRNVIDENGKSTEASHHMIRPDIASGGNKADLDNFDRLAVNVKKEDFSTMSKGTANRGKSKKPYAARRPYGTIMPYGPDRPYYPSEQNSYHSPYLKEAPYVERPPLPSYVMPVAIVPDFKLEKEVKEKEKDIVYAPDITHKPEIATVPQIKKVVIKDVDYDDDTTTKRDYSKMPDDTILKIYYSSLGLLGLYIFLKLFERKG